MNRLKWEHDYRACKNRIRIWKAEKFSKRKLICGCLAVMLAAAATTAIVRHQSLLAEAKMEKTQEQLAQEVLRFHILANSDSKKDQALKMKVKEAVLAYMKAELPHSNSAAETKAWAREHETQIEALSKDLIEEQGYDYQVRAEVTWCEFPDKTYGDVTFPAGSYEALRIEIGSARGHNWWCVLYPNLCFTDAAGAVVPEEGKAELKEVLTEDEYEMVTATSQFKIKWFFLGEDQ